MNDTLVQEWIEVFSTKYPLKEVLTKVFFRFNNFRLGIKLVLHEFPRIIQSNISWHFHRDLKPLPLSLLSRSQPSFSAYVSYFCLIRPARRDSAAHLFCVPATILRSKEWGKNGTLYQYWKTVRIFISNWIPGHMCNKIIEHTVCSYASSSNDLYSPEIKNNN